MSANLMIGVTYDATVVEHSLASCAISVIFSGQHYKITGEVNGVRYNLKENRSFQAGDLVKVTILKLEPLILSMDKAFIKPLLIFDVHGVLGYRIPFQKNTFNRAFITRPHCQEFLEFCFQHFEVAVWSSALMKNVTLTMFGGSGEDNSPLFVWSQAEITDMSPIASFKKATRPLHLKDMRRVWERYPSYDSSNSLLLDNDLEKCAVSAARDWSNIHSI